MAIQWRYSEVWGSWVPEETPRESLPVLEPLPLFGGPLEPHWPHRCNDPRCHFCWNAGQRYLDYLKAKRCEW
jgi:hypothetical protein